MTRASELRYQKSPKGKAATRNRHLRRLYGITHKDYIARLDAQHGHCALCLRTPAEERWGVLCVDHDHNKRKEDANYVRGLLCRRHNDALNAFGDNAIGIARVLLYVLGEPCP